MEDIEKICAENHIVARWFLVYGKPRVQVKTGGLPFVERDTLEEAVTEILKTLDKWRKRPEWITEYHGNLGFNYKW